MLENTKSYWYDDHLSFLFHYPSNPSEKNALVYTQCTLSTPLIFFVFDAKMHFFFI
jgi:hypothetical protein